MKYYCKQSCYFRARLWRLGETLDAAEGETVPRHFIKEKPVEVVEVNKGTALSELTSREELDLSHDKPIAVSQYGKQKLKK